MKRPIFICRGCHRERSSNPRLAPGVQQFCSSSKCQRLRQNRWELERLAEDEEYRARRTSAKARWRQAHSREDAAYRRKRRASRSAEPARSGPIPHSASVSAPKGQASAGTKLASGPYLIRPVNEPESATQIVDLVLLPADRSYKSNERPRQTRSGGVDAPQERVPECDGEASETDALTDL